MGSAWLDSLRPACRLGAASLLLTACLVEDPRGPGGMPYTGDPSAGEGDETTSTATSDSPGATGSTDAGEPTGTTDGGDSTGGTTDDGGLPPAVDALPIWIAAANYLEQRDELAGLGPFVVYAWASDPAFAGFEQELGLLQQIDDPEVTEIIMLSSWTTLESVLQSPGADALHAAGVEGFGYNTEGMMTPAAQMQALDDPSPQSNPVAIFSSLAAEHGLWTVWGPIRLTVDAVSDQAIAAMVAGGLRGVALQEQQPIEQSCVGSRVDAVEATAARYRAIAGDPGFELHVQVMPSRCADGDAFAVAECGMAPGRPTYAHCGDFAGEIAPTIDALAIWASSPTDRAGLVPLVEALRAAVEAEGHSPRLTHAPTRGRGRRDRQSRMPRPREQQRAATLR